MNFWTAFHEHSIGLRGSCSIRPGCISTCFFVQNQSTINEILMVFQPLMNLWITLVCGLQIFSTNICIPGRCWFHSDHFRGHYGSEAGKEDKKTHILILLIQINVFLQQKHQWLFMQHQENNQASVQSEYAAFVGQDNNCLSTQPVLPTGINNCWSASAQKHIDFFSAHNRERPQSALCVLGFSCCWIIFSHSKADSAHCILFSSTQSKPGF